MDEGNHGRLTHPGVAKSVSFFFFAVRSVGNFERSLSRRHGMKSLKKYEEIEKTNFRRPLLLHAENPVKNFAAYIDVDNKFGETDKLSQVKIPINFTNRKPGNRTRPRISGEHTRPDGERGELQLHGRPCPRRTHPHPRHVVRHLHRGHLLLLQKTKGQSDKVTINHHHLSKLVCPFPAFRPHRRQQRGGAAERPRPPYRQERVQRERADESRGEAGDESEHGAGAAEDDEGLLLHAVLVLVLHQRFQSEV